MTEKTEVIQKGTKGIRVEILQKKLLQIGYTLPRFGADGGCGDETLAAVDNFVIERRMVPCPDKNGDYKADTLRDLIQSGSIPSAVENRINVEPADTLRGADFSQYQGEVDWEAFAGSGIRFCWIRGTIGRQGLDKKFFDNWNGARLAQEKTASGFKIGMYHLWIPESDPTEQAENILRRILPLRKNGDLRVALDVEGECKMSGAEVSDRLQKTINRLRREGPLEQNPVIYTSARICREWSLTTGQDCPVWLANYTRGRTAPPLPPQWEKSGFNVWQTGYGGRKGKGRGTIPGVETDLDRNLLPGGEAALKFVTY